MCGILCSLCRTCRSFVAASRREWCLTRRSHPLRLPPAISDKLTAHRWRVPSRAFSHSYLENLFALPLRRSRRSRIPTHPLRLRFGECHGLKKVCRIPLSSGSCGPSGHGLAAAAATLASITFRIKRFARSTKASVSPRQLSRSTPTPWWPETSAAATRAMYSPMRR